MARTPLKALIDERRRAHPQLPADAPWWGLALSGGGIRSATFALGLLRALARQRRLLRFDLLSTVSGGGYSGAAVARLGSPVGLQAPLLIGGAVIIEQIFVIPGMGLLLLDAVNQRDYPIITGVFLIVGVGVMLINLLVDLSYGLLDPRVRNR